MPLTPRFEINQDPTKVEIDIDVPNIRINNETMEILLTDNNTVIHFYASPYLLKLNFYPHEFVTTTSTSTSTPSIIKSEENDDGIISAQYDPILQKVKIPLQKKIPNIEWPNLDLTARLIEPTTIPKRWLHSIVDENDNIIKNEEPEEAGGADDKDNNNNVDHNNNDNNNIISEIETSFSSSSSSDGYGFGNMYQNLFIDYCRSGLAIEMFQQMPLEISPETTTQIERHQLRITKENNDFDIDRYIQDLVTIEEDYLYPLVMDYIPFWKQKQKQRQEQSTSSSTETTTHNNKVDSSSSPSSSYFTSDEQLQLSSIPYPLIPKKYFYEQIDHVEINTNKIHHHDHEQEQECFKMIVNLLDLIVPFVYDHITTMGEPTVESAWTISTLSCSLSWLDPPYPTTTTTTNECGSSSNSNNDRDFIQDVVISISRRMLIYPYWRNWDFVVKMWTNTIQIFDLGIHEIIRSLLKLRSILDKSEYYYLGNKLYVDPYLFWIQKNSTTTIFQQSICRVVQGLNRIFVNNNHSPTKNQFLKNQLGLGDLIQYEQDMFQVDDDEENDDDDDGDGDDDSSDESADASEVTSSDDSSSSGDSTSDESDHDDDDDDEEDNDDKNSTQNNILASSACDDKKESLQRTIKDDDNSNMPCNINEADETTTKKSNKVECVSNSLLDCEIGHDMSLLKIVDDEQQTGNEQNDGGGTCDVKESFIPERQYPANNNGNNGDNQNATPLIVEME